MADKKISELPLITTISGSIVFVPIVHDGITEKITVQNFSKYTSQYSAHTGSAGNVFTGPQTINNNVTITGNEVVNGNVTINGRLTVYEVVAQYETASILFSTGSTKLGDQITDRHEFTGSTNITGSFLVNGANLSDFSASNSTLFTNYSSSVSESISSYSASNSTVFTNFSSSNAVISQIYSASNSTTFTNLSSSNSTTFTNFSSSNAVISQNISASNSTTFTNYSSSVSQSISSYSSSNSTTFTNFSSSNAVISQTYSASNSTTFTNYSSSVSQSISSYSASNSTTFTNYSSSNAVISQTYSASNSTTFTNFSSSNAVISQTYSASNSTTFTNYSSSTATTINNVSTGVGSELSRVYQTTASLNTQTGSQGNLNAQIGIATGSLNAQTGSQESMNTTLSIVTGSMRAEIGGIEAYTASLKSAIIVNGTNVRIIGELTASRIYTEFITSSVLFVTGSNIIGDQSTDKHEFTGSVHINDTLFIKGIAQGTGELNAFTGSQIGKDGTLAIVTSSLRAEIGGIEAYTASLKNSTIVSSSTQIFTGYDYEIHVSQVDGNDTTGNGDLLTPVATITKALQIVTANFGVTDRRTIILHPGTYTENPTISIANTYIFALGLLGANTAIAGTLTINAACRVSGIKMTNLVVNTTSPVYINNTTVDTQMTVTNTGYLETTGCSFQCPSGVTISGAASTGIVFNSTTLWGLVVNNASAIVIVRNSPQVLVASVTAGNLALSNTLLFSSTPTGNAITTSAGSVVTLSNLNILDNTGLAVARVSLSGFYSIIDVVYDKPNSTLVALSGTGGPLNAIDYFQYINADKFITQGGTGYQFLKGDGSLDSIMPASLQQTTASLNTFTGSIQSEVSGIEAYTASLKGAAIVSSSQQITNYYKFAETASANIFYNYQAISGSKLELHTSDANGGIVVNSKASTSQTFMTFIDKGTNDNYVVGTFVDINGTNSLGGLAVVGHRKDNQSGLVLRGQNKVANSNAVNGYITSVIGNAYSDNALTTLTTGVTGKSISFLGQDTELANLNFNGDLTITNGNLVVASGKGISFAANTGGAGKSSQLLNDYEEGLVTATITCSSSGTVTLDSGYNLLSYVKIGSIVHVTGLLYVTSVSSPVGAFSVPLPFAVANLADAGGTTAANCHIDNTDTANSSDFCAIVNETETVLRVYLGNSNSLTSNSAQQLKTGASIYISVTYRTS
jgi:hypothetical protein